MKKYDEINLFEISLHVFLFLKRSKFLLLAFVVVGVVIGIIQSNLNRTSYGTDIEASSSVLPNTRSAGIINGLNGFVKSRNVEVIKEKMNVSTEAAESLKRLEAEPIKEKGLDATSSMFQASWVEIHVELYDPKYFEEIREGLKYLFQNNQYIAKRMGVKTNQLKSLIDGFNSKLGELDSLGNTVSSAPLKGDELVFLSTDHALQIDVMSMMKEQSKLQEELEFIEALSIINDFSQFDQSRGMLFQAVVYGVLFFCLGIAVAFLLMLYRRINDHIQAEES